MVFYGTVQDALTVSGKTYLIKKLMNSIMNTCLIITN